MPIATPTGLPGTAVRPSRPSANGESGRSYALEMRPRPPGASLFSRARLAGLRRRHVFLCQDRPAFVVAPLAVDLQVARREALQAEAGSLGQRDRALVARLDVRLEPVQSQ